MVVVLGSAPSQDCAESPSTLAYKSWNSIMIVGTVAAAKQLAAPPPISQPQRDR